MTLRQYLTTMGTATLVAWMLTAVIVLSVNPFTAQAAVIVAFSHLLFNISGIVIWWPFKFVPITLAEKFAGIAVRKKIIPILYVIIVFFLVPVLLILVSR